MARYFRKTFIKHSRVVAGKARLAPKNCRRFLQVKCAKDITEWPLCTRKSQKKHPLSHSQKHE